MRNTNPARRRGSLWLIAVACTASGIGLVAWLAASVAGPDTLAFGVVLLAAFGYPSFRAVATLNEELYESEEPVESWTAN